MMIENRSDLMLFLSEYGKDNITFFYDVTLKTFTISTKAKNFFGRESLRIEEIYEIIEPNELEMVGEKVKELMHSENNKASITCRLKDANNFSYLCTCDLKVLFNEESGRYMVYVNIYPHRNKRETLDPITNFKTVNYLYEHLRELAETKKPYLLLGLKLLKFNDITSIYGYDFANEVLRALCDKVKQLLSRKTSVYRLEGTRFLGVCEGISIEEVEGKFAELQEVTSSFEYKGKKVGMTLFGSVIDASEVELVDERLISHILSSLDKSSTNHRYSLVILGQEDIDKNARRVEFYNHIQASIVNNFDGFYLKYQPLVSSKGGNIIGAEALLRWKSSVYGDVLPNDFIDYIETQPLFYEMGLWIMATAMCDVKPILSTHPNFVINVNISYSQLENKHFKNDVMDLIQKMEFPHKNLQFELTERCRDINPEFLFEQLSFFSKQGIKISLDDFGTGISSIDLLCNMPINTMKIDQTFIRNILTNSSCKSVVDMSLECANKLGLKVCLEGVESEEIHDYVANLNATYHQGFYYSKPITIEEIKQILDEKWISNKVAVIKSNTKNQYDIENIVSMIPGGFVIYRDDPSERIISVNESLLRIYECNTVEEFYELTNNSFKGMVHPDDYARVERQIYEQIEVNDDFDYVEYRIITKTGKVKEVRDYGHLIRGEDDSEDVFYVFIAPKEVLA